MIDACNSLNCPVSRSEPRPRHLVHPGRWPAIGAFVLQLHVLAAFGSGTIGNNFIRGQYHELRENGAWSWFMDERVLVDHGRLLVGSVRAEGEFADSDRPNWGNVELSTLDLESGARQAVVLHQHFEQDDHNGPGLLVLADGRYLAMYSKHNQETKFYFRISIDPGDPYHWAPVQEVVTPGVAGNFRGDSVTYANPIRLTSEHGRTYVFHRGVGLDPNYRRHHELFRGTTSDAGATWRWTAVTSNSSTDNLRPIVPVWKDARTVVVWMRGSYRVNRGEWTTKVVATILKPDDF